MQTVIDLPAFLPLRVPDGYSQTYIKGIFDRAKKTAQTLQDQISIAKHKKPSNMSEINKRSSKA
jgi:hypothetical protein